MAKTIELTKSEKKRLDKITTHYKGSTKTAQANLIYSLAGPANKTARQKFMFYLTGKVYPVAKCGIHRIEEELKKQLTK